VLLLSLSKRPVEFVRGLYLIPEFTRGLAWSDLNTHDLSATSFGESVSEKDDTLFTYFDNHNEGPGIWKWEHYFKAYNRHLSKFKNKPVNLLEIGIYSGGSLDMWLNYFGESCRIYGVDIEEVCKSYESDKITVYIGDQEDRIFWRKLKDSFLLDIHILIDDGGHKPEQQIVTLEEMLPVMPPGSVYICEDVLGLSNRFTSYASALIHKLNEKGEALSEVTGFKATQLQSQIYSIHFYPFLCVIEKNEVPLEKLVAPKKGNQWQPFL
jgi:hypothetical protein